MKAVIIGASGLVGNHLVDILLRKRIYDEILLVVRRQLPISDPRVAQLVIEDFGKIDQYESEMQGQDFYCTLGTTIKTAGSKEAFMKVDLEYPMFFAQTAQRSKDFRQLLIVTAAGSNIDSPIFYNQVKGQLEKELQSLNLKSLKIFKPTLLMGDRKEFRLGELMAQKISRFFSFFLLGRKRHLWFIEASDVAASMVLTAGDGSRGVRLYSAAEMIKMTKYQGL